ncbi:MAG: shikimate kinase [Nitrososphaerota archaeon]|nr:shikimate kinase [Candidatus Bathyarchaeota archaeon]MDW8048482.1 shikimate kinase [Nitrososphaerota archaeon]
MTPRGRAVAYGAVTIVNAISCGLGAALGIDLQTEASVRLTNEPGKIEGRILSDPNESIILIQKTVSRVLRHFNLEEEYGAYVETRSNIPVARGLKSSSAAANAVALAVLDALNEDISDLEVIGLGVDAAIEAGVTVTGAFDDACASYFGNVVITDNMERKILRQFIPEEGYIVLVYVPERKSYTATSDIKRMKIIASQVKAIHKLALQGDYWTAMTVNGFLYAAALGYDPKIPLDALEAGAIAAGLSGKGPSVAAVVPHENVSSVKEALRKYDGKIIESKINREKAHAV